MPPKGTTSKGPIGAEEDVKFLLTVIKQLGGTPDWQTVSDELKLPSKGAASKRFSRMPAKYDIMMDKKGTPSPTKKFAEGPSMSPGMSPDAEETPKKGKAKPKPKKANASKKRKVAEVDEDDDVVKSEVESDD